jgi:hypothetical protein
MLLQSGNKEHGLSLLQGLLDERAIHVQYLAP